ncbi:hypothetical protein [Clostridium kluyveri]|uniref:Uncharacterized protein n=1 Tax=Clostridium kluyveri (strain ATCC 8527 / DSM 555 / NBRC 12016 / NCIMB 10680 / K1) TaxID=431943 RepID=A5F9N7_CLOK5|nr:hypothetical protein [Clostridium kluyveri]ABQ23627.1 hypothetical protein CKL_4028 [Clostridium kluyveri DSM 555]
MNNFDEILEAVKKNSGTKVKVEHHVIFDEGVESYFKGFNLLNCMLHNLSFCFDDNQVAEILQNGEWEVQP